METVILEVVDECAVIAFEDGDVVFFDGDGDVLFNTHNAIAAARAILKHFQVGVE